jgi:hypothetical protein
MPALALYRELLGVTNGNCGQREGARGRREPLFVHSNVIVPAFGLLV